MLSLRNQTNDMATPAQRPAQILHHCWNLLQHRPSLRSETVWQKAALSLCGFAKGTCERLTPLITEKTAVNCFSCTQKQSLKDAVTEPPALPGKEVSALHRRAWASHPTKMSGTYLVCRVRVANGHSCSSVLQLPSSPAWTPRHEELQPNFTAVPIWGATWEHHWLRLLVQDFLALSVLVKMESSLMPSNLFMSGGTTCEDAAGLVVPSFLSRDRWACLPSSLVQGGLPTSRAVSLRWWAERRRAVLHGGMPAGFDQTAQISSSFFPTVAKKPKQSASKTTV